MLAAAVLMLLGACKQKTEASEEQPQDNIYQFTVLDGAGNPVSLADYDGQVLLVVNTATQCGFTPQYEALEALYRKYAERGFVVLDFPCNQFGAQAPGSNEEIHAFCTGTPFGGFDTTDPRGAYLDKMFRQQDSLYYQNPDIKWNFSKFLIDRDGNVVRRFEPTDPMSAVAEAVESAL